MDFGSSINVFATQSDKARSAVRALVVEDDVVTGRIHGMLLRRIGFASEVVENGKEAVDLFRAGKSFDFVLMDLEMPVMDGIQATRELRAMEVSSIIAGVTASEDEAKKQAFIEAGLDYCWDKPLMGGASIPILHELARKKL